MPMTALKRFVMSLTWRACFDGYLFAKPVRNWLTSVSFTRADMTVVVPSPGGIDLLQILRPVGDVNLDVDGIIMVTAVIGQVAIRVRQVGGNLDIPRNWLEIGRVLRQSGNNQQCAEQKAKSGVSLGNVPPAVFYLSDESKGENVVMRENLIFFVTILRMRTISLKS